MIAASKENMISLTTTCFVDYKTERDMQHSTADFTYCSNNNCLIHANPTLNKSLIHLITYTTQT